jgi:hypothetical protein
MSETQKPYMISALKGQYQAQQRTNKIIQRSLLAIIRPLSKENHAKTWRHRGTWMELSEPLSQISGEQKLAADF